MRYYPWELKRQGNRWYIKQPVLKDDGKMSSKTYPSKKLREIRDNEDELRALVIRLNAALDVINRTKEAVELKHAFINDAMLDAWEKERRLVTERANVERKYIRRYFLNFFIGKLNLPNPVDWYCIHKSEWAAYLLSDEVPQAPVTKLDIVQCANRFMVWLHEKRPLEVPEMEFKPIGKAKWKTLKAAWTLNEDRLIHKYIPDTDWAALVKSLPQDIAPYIKLAYAYGLRREEVCGLKNGDVKKDNLAVVRSYQGKGKYGPPKGREPRKVPHWFAAPADAYKWVEQINKDGGPIHPDTLGEKFVEYVTTVEKVTEEYTLHDLRHTFCTRAYRAYNKTDVRLAAGHKDIRTTQRYLHDDTDLGDEEYKPTG
jgi:integrase